MTKEIDRVTLAKAQQHEPAACRALVRCYQTTVVSMLWRMMAPRGRRDLVEDLAQETFLRVFRSLPDYQIDGPARLSTWIVTIATRLALNELRKAPPGTSLSALPTTALPVAASEEADQLIRQKALAAALEQAIEALKPEFRAVFLLAEYHELSHREIATSLDIRVGTVKSRLSRARATVASHLSEYLP